MLSAVCIPIAMCLVVVGVRLVFSAPHLIVVGLLFALPTVLRVWLAKPKPGVIVRSTETGLQVGSRFVAQARIDSAFESAADTVTLLLRDKTRIVLEVSEQSPEAALLQLGFDPENRVQHAPLRAALGPFTLGFLTFIGSMFAYQIALSSYRLSGLAVAVVLSILSTAAVVELFGYPRLFIGTDGLRVESGLRKRFIPYSQIQAVRVSEVVRDPRSGIVTTTLEGHGINLDLLGEGHLLLPTVGQSDVQIAALARRIEAGVAAYAEKKARGVHVLERSGRSLTDWRRDLESLARREAGFREQPLDDAELERELRDASAPADRRIGAALALRVKVPEAQERIRIVAGTCADDAVRVALEAVCDDSLDDAVIARAERRSN